MDQQQQNPTESLTCWKQHTCVGCGTVYRYRIRREAAPSMFSGAKEAALEKLKSEVDPHPCPTCGVYQPDMAADVPMKAHLAVAGIALLLTAIIAGTGFSPKVAAAKVAVAGAGLAGLAFLAHLIVMLAINPNRNLGANKMKGEQEVRTGFVQVVSAPPFGQAAAAPRLATPLHFLALLAIAAGAVGFVSQLSVLETVSDLPKNGKHAPGGVVRITFPQTIHSVNGIWMGVAHTDVLNYKEIGAPKELMTGTENKRWQDDIKVSPSSESVEKHLYADLHIPDDPDLDGKTFKVRVSIDVDYPHRVEVGKYFEEFSFKAQTEGEFTLQGERYQKLEEAWGLTAALGFGGVALGCIGIVALTVMFKNRGNPTRLEPLEEQTRGPQEW